MDRQSFYRARDNRTIEYMGIVPWVESRAAIAIDEATASSRSGQVALLALVNMAARVHRHLEVVVPDLPLLARTLVPAPGLREAVIETARAIDPFGRLDLVDARSLRSIPSVGVGPVRGIRCQVYVGADGLLATLGRDPQPLNTADETILGGGLAACLAAAGLLALASGHPVDATRMSLFRFEDGAAAEPGPTVGPGRIDVGDVLVVGAGAVASGLLYWLREIGIAGRWIVVDRDVLELPNTNRSIGTIVLDTGWPDRTPHPKATGAAALVGAEPREMWYDEWLGTEGGWTPDLVLPLANARGVRQAISLRGEPIIIHATTSRDWTAELHRHTPGVDDCIVCRLPDAVDAAPFACSTAEVPSTATGRATDAALPFLSAAAGLLLAHALSMLPAGDLGTLKANHIRLHLGPPGGLRSRFSRFYWPARDGCTHILGAGARRLVRAAR